MIYKATHWSFITQNYISYNDSTMNKLQCIDIVYQCIFTSIIVLPLSWLDEHMLVFLVINCETKSRLDSSLHNFEYICCVKSTKIIIYTPKKKFIQKIHNLLLYHLVWKSLISHNNMCTQFFTYTNLSFIIILSMFLKPNAKQF